MSAADRILAVLSLAIGFVSFGWSNYSAVLPRIISDLDPTGTEAGVIYSAYFVGYVVAILPAGYVADRYSTHILVGLAAIGSGLSGVALGLLTAGVATGSLFRLLAGACFAGVYVPGIRLLSAWFDADRRGRAIGIYVGALGLGSGLAYPLSTWIAATSDWRVALAATSGAAVPAGIAVLWLAAAPPGEPARESSFELSSFTDREFLCLTAAYAGHNWELFGVQNWIVVFLVATPAVAGTGNADVTAGLLAGVLTALGVVGNPLGGWVSDRLGRVSTSTVALGASGCITLALGALQWSVITVLGAVIVVYGVVLAADSAPISTAITEIADDDNIGMALAGQSLIGFVPGIVSPVVFGLALDRAGFTAAFVTLFVGVLIGLGALRLLGREFAAH
jgi:MFS family permease